MKHLIHKKHHAHLKKRAVLEVAGLFVLVAFGYSQRVVIQDAIRTVSEVEAGWFLLLLALYWVMLPLTSFSYRLISPRPSKVKISTTSLAHLAGAGPGRIIPGGIGNMSIGAVHLKKSGLTIEQAVAVVITNNFVGLLANIVLVVAVLVYRPDTLRILTDSITSQQILFAVAAIMAMFVILQWALHARSTRKEIHKTLHQWRRLLNSILGSPTRMMKIIAIALLIIIMHTLMLDFSGFALGIELSLTDSLIALSFGVAIGGVFPTPGGIGGVEAGTIAALVVLGFDGATATSIAVLYRVAVYWQPVIPGTLAYLYLRERKLL